MKKVIITQAVKRLLKSIPKRGQTVETLLAALSTLLPNDALSGFVGLYLAGELNWRRQKKSDTVARFNEYHAVNSRVADWILNAARELRDFDNRTRYGAQALLEKIRFDVRMGVIKTDEFRISNDLGACYARLVLMREPSFCGFFDIKPSAVDATLVIDGKSWAEFAQEHKAEIWPGRPTAPEKKPAASATMPLEFEETGS